MVISLLVRMPLGTCARECDIIEYSYKVEENKVSNQNERVIEMNESTSTNAVVESGDQSANDTVTEMTAYAFAKKLNAALASNDIDVTVRPQMIYNYVAKKYIKSNANGLIDVSEYERFATAYIGKKIALAMAANVTVKL